MDLDEFSDDGFDDLPDNALQELEANAIQFTQAQAQSFSQRPPPPKKPATKFPDVSEVIWIEDDDLDTTEVFNDVGVPIGRPVVDNTLQQQKPQQPQGDARRSVPPPPNPRWNPTVDSSKRVPPRPRPPSVGPANQQAFSSQRLRSQTPTGNRAQSSQFVRPPIPPNHTQNQRAPSQPSQGLPSDSFSALQQRIRALEAELNSVRGEVTITRSRSAKAQEQHDADVARLKKINAEQLAKQERIAEAATAAQQNANTELQFLQREMREVNDRPRRKDPAGGHVAEVTTPKKTTKSWRVADGFDEMDIAVSPNKGQGRNKAGGSVAVNVGEMTPSKGKRKRMALDSPMPALETVTDDIVMAIHEKPEVKLLQREVVTLQPATLPFEFIPLVLDHATLHGQPLTFDVLSRYSLPSEPETSIAARIFQGFPQMGRPDLPMQLLVDFATHVARLWTSCAAAHLWEPVRYLGALIAFTFDLAATHVAPLVSETLVPVAISTIYPLVTWRHRLSDGELAVHDEYLYQDEQIDVTSILSLLYTTALASATATEETESGLESRAIGFWKLLGLDLVVGLLTPRQRFEDVLGMLELLTTSSFPGSIGPITTEKDPPFVAQLIIEQVATKLTEFARGAITSAQRRKIRLATLRTLLAFASHSFGAIQLASHSTVLPRLVTCLSSCIDDLYDQPIPSNILPDLEEEDDLGREENSSSTELCRIISQCVLLIHHLVTSPNTANIADISQKNSSFHGGSQRYLLALGRLAFAEEDLVAEAGIDGETVEAAHELLEMAVTPDEGENIGEAFGA